VRVHYDGNHHYETSGTLVAHNDAKQEEEAGNWIRQNLKPNDSLARVASIGLTAWRSLTEEKPFTDLAAPNGALLNIDGKVVEAALLDRKSKAPVHYRSLNLNQLKD